MLPFEKQVRCVMISLHFTYQEDFIMFRVKISVTLVLIMVLGIFSLAACDSTPNLSEGESYFVGDVDFGYAESCTVSYVLSADGASIRDVKVSLKNYKFQDKYTSGSFSKNINESISSRTSKLISDGKLDGNGFIEVPSREITLRFYITENSATGEMDYRYMNAQSETPKIEIPLGTYSFVMVDKTDTLASN